MLENFQPHMHLRGKAMAVEAILPDGSTQMISYVGNFNFNWMTNYIYADDAAPVFPKGTIIHVTAWYDNTKAIRTIPIRISGSAYGDRTVDEMAHAWMNVTYFSDDEYNAWAAKHKERSTASGRMRRSRSASMALPLRERGSGLRAIAARRASARIGREHHRRV